jgi:NAD(P)-dependent dehydrogenase (short-subunit alcohol dehydrogenase family)
VLVADRGVSVDGTGADPAPATETVADIESAGGIAASYEGDLSTEEGALGAVQATVAAFGRIDGIIHNASTAPGSRALYQTPMELIDRTLRINIHAAFHMVRAAWPAFIEQEYGRVVVISSHAIYGTGGSTAYAASKASYIAFVRSLAQEGAERNILVNGVAPTARTRMLDPMQPSAYTTWLFRTMLPEHVSPTATYLASEKCAVNGQVFSASGGRVARITLAESRGVLGLGQSLEAVHQAMGEILADQDWFFPTSSTERGLEVAKAMGWGPAVLVTDAHGISADSVSSPSKPGQGS